MTEKPTNRPLEALRHHVSGAIQRGEAEAIVEQRNGQASDHAPYAEHLKSVPLNDALWWFIENVNEEDPHRNDYFFALRERVRSEGTTAPRLGIRLEGGVIQSTFSDAPVDIIVIDYDTDGADEDDLFPMPQDDGDTSPCYLQEYASAVMPEEIKRIVAAIEAHEAAKDADEDDSSVGAKP